MQDRVKDMAEIKICESCGESFGCGAKLDGCWCFDIEIPAAAATVLKSQFSDCLCPKCLTEDHGELNGTTKQTS
ncbi:MAG: cysteine-rich CWC family protein [Pyrinomonadaceae bacterium]|nr:cysteine-rich CWC family protein [Acidobacteriota bacterium]MBK7932536.1 cysteine-rich CWC family protein [Acidobacteriota bacterium]MBP7375746.1 cysteine-rich CWC family protein [Pyrinomonadaceae bacterium]